LYGIWPGNGADLFLQPRIPHEDQVVRTDVQNVPLHSNTCLKTSSLPVDSSCDYAVADCIRRRPVSASVTLIHSLLHNIPQFTGFSS